MATTITQKIVFKNTTAKVLYDLYMNTKKHALVTGSPATISTKVGGKYTAHGGYINGENLQLVKDKIIVQTWRAQGWDEKDSDSIFMLNFEQKGKDVVAHVVHTNLPDKHSTHIDKGWHDHYWNPWKASISAKPVKKGASKKMKN
jgi:activator of HSP90 ATPase